MAKGTSGATATKKPAKTKHKPQKPGKPAGFATKVSDERVRESTGKTWDQWFDVLDRAGCRKMNHKQIVAVVGENGAGPWWQQMVTVGYEQSRGLRELYEKCDGDFQMSGSKTVNVPVERLFDAWDDPRLRAKWLEPIGDSDLVIRKSTRPKSLRVTWCDGRTNVDVNLFPKGDAKSYVSMNHTKLKDAKAVEKMKRYWSAQLERMKALLES